MPLPISTLRYDDLLVRESVFAAQTTLMMFKMKMLHEQEMDALRAARPARLKITHNQSQDETHESEETDFYQVFVYSLAFSSASTETSPNNFLD